MSTDYTESRHHELRKARLLMVDGRLVNNQRSVDAAASARVHEGGYWGFASSAEVSGDRTLLDRARRNARSMSRFGTRSAAALPIDAHVGEHDLRGATPLTSAQAIERLAALDAWCRTRYPDLASVRLLAQEERHDKRLHTSTGSRCRSVIARGTLHVTMTASARDGAPVELPPLDSSKQTRILMESSWPRTRRSRRRSVTGTPTRRGRRPARRR